MHNKLRATFRQLLPFLAIGVSIVLAVGLLILSFHILVWGAIIGGILWLALQIKKYLFPQNPQPPITPSKGDETHRIIEHDQDELP